MVSYGSPEVGEDSMRPGQCFVFCSNCFDTDGWVTP